MIAQEDNVHVKIVSVNILIDAFIYICDHEVDYYANKSASKVQI